MKARAFFFVLSIYFILGLAGREALAARMARVAIYPVRCVFTYPGYAATGGSGGATFASTSCPALLKMPLFINGRQPS